MKADVHVILKYEVEADNKTAFNEALKELREEPIHAVYGTRYSFERKKVTIDKINERKKRGLK